MAIDLIGVPLDLGSERIGVDMAPNALRYQKFVDKLVAAGLSLHDQGNIPCPTPEEVPAGDPHIKYLAPIARVCKNLAEHVAQSVSDNHQVLVIGGDHSVAIGSIAGARTKGRIGVIWIDAHGDLNTHHTTPSGNIHGMPLAALLGHGHDTLTSLTDHTPVVDYQDVVLVGTKDLDSAEVEFIAKHSLTNFSITDILAHGLGPVFEAIKNLKDTVDYVWLSLDLDAVDADYAPGVGMPNKGGLTYREIHAIIEVIGKECDILGMDLVEYNPVNDIQNKTATLAAELTAKAFSKEYSWYTEYLKDHRT